MDKGGIYSEYLNTTLGCFSPLFDSVTSTSYLPHATDKKRLDDNKHWILFVITFVVLIITCFAFVCVIFIKPKIGKV